jgi:hypothetical protein
MYGSIHPSPMLLARAYQRMGGASFVWLKLGRHQARQRLLELLVFKAEEDLE